MVTNSHSKAKPKTITSPNAASPSRMLPWSRNPTANAIATVTAEASARMAVSAITRAASTELRGIGSERSRSTKPCSRSSAVATAAPMPEKSTPVAMKPGTR